MLGRAHSKHSAEIVLVRTLHQDATALAAALAPLVAPVKVTERAAVTATKGVIVGLLTDDGSPQRLRSACADWPHLRFVVYLAHGGSDLLGVGLPQHVALLRLRDPFITRAVADYVMLHLLSFHRHQPAYQRQQARRVWRALASVDTCERHVAILGLGEIGATIARRVTALGFQTRGWSRTAKRISGVRCYHGALRTVLRGADVLINVLPGNKQTCSLIGAAEFATLRRGACVINVGRGTTLSQDALLTALRCGQVSHAVLDVTDPEPLPRRDPLWRNAHVIVTPHISGQRKALSMPAIARLLRAAIMGRAEHYRVDPARGY